MAKKNSIFSGKPLRKDVRKKIEESDWYKRVYGKTHDQRVAEYKEWKQKEMAKGYNLSTATKGKEGHARIEFLIKMLDDDKEKETFRDLYDDTNPNSFFELGQKIVSGEKTVEELAKEAKEKDKFSNNPRFKG